MGPSNSSYLSNIAIFHFHDYGRESKNMCKKKNLVWCDWGLRWAPKSPEPSFTVILSPFLGTVRLIGVRIFLEKTAQHFQEIQRRREILLMAEILQNPGCKNPLSSGKNYPSTGAGFLPSTVLSAHWPRWKNHSFSIGFCPPTVLRFAFRKFSSDTLKGGLWHSVARISK